MSTPAEHTTQPGRTTTYAPAEYDPVAFFGHYEPSRERVQMLLDYALAHDHDPFWRALAQRLTSPGCGSPWNAAIAAAEDASVFWGLEARIRRVTYSILYEGRRPGQRFTRRTTALDSR